MTVIYASVEFQEGHLYPIVDYSTNFKIRFSRDYVKTDCPLNYGQLVYQEAEGREMVFSGYFRTNSKIITSKNSSFNKAFVSFQESKDKSVTEVIEYLADQRACETLAFLFVPKSNLCPDWKRRLN